MSLRYRNIYKVYKLPVLHFRMKRKLKGKQRLPVIDSLVYSNFIFQIASGNNYAQKIYESYKKIYKKPKSASVISRQLDILENEEHFLTSESKENKNIFPMQKLRIYSVNWEKIIEEFIKGIKKQKKTIIEENKRLNANLEEVFGSRMKLLRYLDNEEFIKNIKNNSYLKDYIRIYFIKVARVSRIYTISEVLSYILYFGDLDFLHSINSNIQRVVSLLEKQKLGELPSNIIGMQEEDWKKAVNKAEEKEHKERLRKIAKQQIKEFSYIYEKTQKKGQEIVNKDIQLKELLILDNIFKILRFELTLQTSLNETTSEISNIILRKHFSEEEMKRVEQFNFNLMRPKTKEEYAEDTAKVQKPHIDKEK